MRFHRTLKNQRGSMMIIYTLLLTIILALCALIIDVGVVMVEKQKLQNAIDATCLAAAQDLPDTINAADTSYEYIQLNGYTPEDVLITFSDNNNTINITGTKTINFFFARILGYTSTSISPSASASIVAVGDAFNYVLFSGSKSATLTLNGSSHFVDGSSHTNKNFIANGSKITITGACEALTSITINGSQIDVPNKYPNAPFVPMPDFETQIKQQAQDAGQLYNGNKTFNGSFIEVDNSIYVNGNVTVNGSHFRGTGCLLATGNITFNGSNLNESTEDAICFYTSNGNITVNGSHAKFDGILYAPNGNITMNGSNQTVNGRVIGNTVTINGSQLNIIGGGSELKSLPSQGVKLIK